MGVYIMNTFTIETHNLTRKFENYTSVNKLNLKVPSGKIYGFLGPNGAGKTTTIRMLLGLIQPSEGEITVFKQNLHKSRYDILKRVGSLVESPSYYGHLSGYKNLKIMCTLLNTPEKRIDDVLKLVRLEQYKNRPVKKYSLGMKQRLAIALALIHEPDLLILDEPTNGLDPSGIKEMRELMTYLSHEKGMTILISSHILSEIEAIADHVGIINRGELIFQGDINQLRERSQKSFLIKLDDIKKACSTLLNSGFIAEITNEGLLVTLQHDDSQQKMFDLLNVFSIYQINERNKTLEDIFLEMTGRGISV
jgi:lantibiotic transport system ATP-binding protein